jgi:membrane associated rhomboid family serine protease
MTLIGVNAVVFALQLLLGSAFAHRFDFYPPNALIEPWRFVTSAFLHSQSLPIHILFNMYALWMVGQYLEPILGRTRFLALYVISALGGSAGYFLVVNPLSDGWRTGALGASGAVFGLFAAYLVVNRRLGRDSRGMVVLLVINAAFGFFPGIAWQAHVGGFVTGLLVTAVLAYTPRERRTALQPLALAAVVVLLAALVLLKASTVPAALLAAG